ncbi:MAG TPA: hypothetical protein VNY31_08100 [Solirubrobacteraceae bacterium]|nr:hypothetical protein [Solirubrobacteraceae bacterium]
MPSRRERVRAGVWFAPAGRRCAAIVLGASVLLVGVIASSGVAAPSTPPPGPVIATVYCPNQSNTNCSRVFGQGQEKYAHAPTGFDHHLGCRWYNTGYGSGLGEDKNYCVAPPGVVFFAQGQSPESPAYRPRELGVAGEGSFYVRNVTWTSWGPKSATGHGTAGSDDCSPDCAHGTFHYAPVSITLSTPRKKCGIPEYTRGVFVFTHGPPPGTPLPRTDRWTLAVFPCEH